MFYGPDVYRTKAPRRSGEVLQEGCWMRSASERVEAMHERARLLRRARDRTINGILTTISAFMLIVIIVLAALPGGGFHTIENAGETGSSLLDAGVGGYVLVAVASFMLAVIITVLCIRWREKKHKSEEKH